MFDDLREFFVLFLFTDNPSYAEPNLNLAYVAAVRSSSGFRRHAVHPKPPSPLASPFYYLLFGEKKTRLLGTLG